MHGQSSHVSFSRVDGSRSGSLKTPGLQITDSFGQRIPSVDSVCLSRIEDRRMIKIW